MLNARSSGVDTSSESGNMAESLTRIVQQCPEEVRARMFSLMNAENSAQFVVHVDHRLRAFLDSKKSKKNDDRSIFEKRRNTLDIGTSCATSQPTALNPPCLSWQQLLPSFHRPSDFSSDEEEVFSSAKEDDDDDDASAFSDDRERSFSTTDSESQRSYRAARCSPLKDEDSFLSDGDVSLKQTPKAAEPDLSFERLQETQLSTPEEIDVDGEQFSADEMKGDSSDTDISGDLKCLRFSNKSSHFGNCDGDEERNERESDMSESGTAANIQCGYG